MRILICTVQYINLINNNPLAEVSVLRINSAKELSSTLSNNNLSYLPFPDSHDIHALLKFCKLLTFYIVNLGLFWIIYCLNINTC